MEKSIENLKKQGFVSFSLNIEYSKNKKDEFKKNLDFGKNYKWSSIKLNSNSYIPDFNAVGIKTGAESGIMVLDIDDIEEWNKFLSDVGEKEPQTVKVISGNNGFHYYFKYTDEVKHFKSSTNVIENYKGIDIRNDGGFIIAPPTKYFNPQTGKYNKYKWETSIFEEELEEMPKWLISAIEKKTEKKSKKEKVKEATDLNKDSISDEDCLDKYLSESEKISDDDLDKLMSKLKDERYDDYSSWLILCMIFVNEKLNLKILDKYSRKSKKYDKTGNEKIISKLKINENGYTIATLYKYLKEDDMNTFNQLSKTRLDFWNMLKYLNHFEIAKFYFNLNPNNYAVSRISKKTFWFEYNKNNTISCCGEHYPSGLLNSISSTMQEFIGEQMKNLDPKNSDDKDKMKLITSCFKNMGNSKFVSCVIDYLKSLYYVDKLDEKIDANKNLLAFENCVYDLTIKDFRDITPCDYIQKTTGYNLKKYSDPIIRNEIEKILFDIFNDKEHVDYFKKISSMSLFGNTGQYLYIHTGTGSNGKSMLSAIYDKVLGDYFYETDNEFLTSFKKGGAPNSSLANAKGKRYLSLQEPENEFLNTEFVKNITGSDKITTRDLFSGNITYKNLFTPHLQCNLMPKLNKLDGGIMRRIKVINYPNKFVDKPKLPNEKKKSQEMKDKLMEQKYINEFILILLDNIKLWDIIETPRDVEEETKKYLEENNPIKNYLETYIDFTGKKEDKIKCSELYAKFIELNDNENNLTPQKFNKLLPINGITKKSIVKGNNYYDEIKFKNI